MKTFIIIATAFALSAAPAAALDFDSAPAQHVSYSDLDLGSSAGKAALQQRIQAAATRVCNTETGKQSLQDNLAGRVCYRTSVADGFHQMDRLIAARQSGAVLASAITVIGIR